MADPTDPTESPSERSDLDRLLEEARRRGGEDQFWSNRGKAIQAYARLEQALWRVFAVSAGISDENRAAIIFYKITNTQARNAILDKLIKAHYRRTFTRFWNSVLKDLRPIDIKRNEIVHWSVSTDVKLTTSGVSEPEVVMRPPSSPLAFDDLLPTIKNQDLIDFIKRCNFYSHVILTFVAVVSGGVHPPISSDDANAWLDIFRQPLIYPLPEGVQLPQRPTGFGFLPRSFLELMETHRDTSASLETPSK